MIAWSLLIAAILLEVAATICLRMAAVGGSKWWYAAVGAGYIVSFGLLSLTLRTGFPSASPMGSGRRQGSRSPQWPGGFSSRSG